MAIAFARSYRLVPRGGAGLACDDDGVSLGPVALIEAVIEPSGQRSDRLRPEQEVAQALRLAYAYTTNEIERYRQGLTRVAELLAAGDRAQASLQAVLLASPEIAPDSMTKLAHAATLQKDNPNWQQEPRVPGGNPGAGDWTNDGGAGDVNIRPAAASMNPVQAMKERFVDAHLADTQAAAGRLGIPVENILGVAALESNWGASRIAVQGKNFFGINYPAPNAVGPLPLAPGGTTRYSKFASYVDSLKSFVAIAGALVQGKSEPEAFAAALQNSGKFGVHDNGAKVPTYVPQVVATIRGLRAIVARRNP